MTAAQGCNDADAGSTETRNRGWDARTPFSLDSRGEDTFTYVRSLVPNLSPSILGNVINFASYLPAVFVSLCRVVQEDRSFPELLRRNPAIDAFCCSNGECFEFRFLFG